MTDTDHTHTVELADDQLQFIHDLVDDAISSDDIETQDMAIEVMNELPEPNSRL